MEALADPGCGWLYKRDTTSFKDIPGMPVAYWATDAVFRAFRSYPNLKSLSPALLGLYSRDNELMIRYWHEIGYGRVGKNAKCSADFSGNTVWLPHCKGGNFRNWFGNMDLVVWFKDAGEAIRKNGIMNNEDCYYIRGITWTALSSSRNSFRIKPYSVSFDSNKGPFIADSIVLPSEYLLGLFNSSIAVAILQILNPTLSLQNGDMNRFPICINSGHKNQVVDGATTNIEEAKKTGIALRRLLNSESIHFCR